MTWAMVTYQWSWLTPHWLCFSFNHTVLLVLHKIKNKGRSRLNAFCHQNKDIRSCVNEDIVMLLFFYVLVIFHFLFLQNCKFCFPEPMTWMDFIQQKKCHGLTWAHAAFFLVVLFLCLSSFTSDTHFSSGIITTLSLLFLQGQICLEKPP